MADVATKSRGWEGAVLKLLGADDFTLTVTGTSVITDHYVRVDFTDGGLLTKHRPHPTMWVRMWFEERTGKLHQRGYTIVDPDVSAGTFGVEFAIHDGAAARWAQNAEPGDTIPVTFKGSKFAVPSPAPKSWLVAGDPAALPAINSLLDTLTAAGDSTPATIWFEWTHESDRELPLRARPQDTVHWIRRERDGEAIVDAVREAAFDAAGHFGWVALDAPSTRAVAAVFKEDFKLGKREIKAQAYWRPDAPAS